MRGGGGGLSGPPGGGGGGGGGGSGGGCGEGSLEAHAASFLCSCGPLALTVPTEKHPCRRACHATARIKMARLPSQSQRR